NPLAFVEKLKKNWAKGQRLAFFTSHIPGYSAAAMEGHSRATEYPDVVINSYFQRFHWKLRVSEESDVPFNPESPPFPEDLTPAEAEQKKHKVLAMKKAIRSWFDYRVKSLRKAGRRAKGERDPWARLLGQLSGVSKSKPKALQPHQRWSKDHSKGLSRTAGLSRARVESIWLLFDAREYKKMAKSEGKAAMEKWHADLAAPPSTVATDRQRALDTLSSFAGPILAGMHEILGMHVTLLVGDPESRKDGQINVLCMHEGVNSSAHPQNWQQSDKKKFKAVVVLFQDYLSGCYCTLTTLVSPHLVNQPPTAADERQKRKLPDQIDGPDAVVRTYDDDQTDAEASPSNFTPNFDPEAKP
ncbi:hypothetical protein BV22DRAFT_1026505, partial [Leucogyrophana mollusca]